MWKFVRLGRYLGCRSSFVLWQPLIKTINSTLSSLLGQESCGNHKRIQQEVPDIFLHYIYY